MAASSTSSIEKKKYREILSESCTSTENGFVLCAIDTTNSCKYRQKADKFDAGNFIRHIRTEHPVLAKSRGLMKDEAEVSAKKRKVSKKLIAIDRQTYVEAIIKLVTLHHVPLHCVEWEGLQLLLNPISNALNMCMNRPNLLRHLNVAAEKVKSAIKCLVKGKLLCLKIDSATRHGRHILGVNIQFFDPEQQKILILTIGMIELNERQTAKFLKSKIQEILAEYGISLEQIFSITCDNGANMIAAVRQLHSYLQVMIFPTEDDEDDPTEEFIDWTDAIEKEFFNSITLVRCAVHTIQLAVTDVIKECDSDIRECTSVAKNCRKISYKPVFDLRNQSLPPLYARTRWGGIFTMLEHFIKHEDFFRDLGSQYPELDLTEKWTFIRDYVAAFEPIFLATKNMQAQHTSLNDFYLTWIKTAMDVSKIISNRFVEPLTASLSRRLQQLKDNMVFMSALLIDPRFNYLNSTLFTSEEKEEVRKFIIATWERIKRMKPQDADQPSTSHSTSTSGLDQDQHSDLDAFLTQMFGGSLPESDSRTPQTSDTFLRQLNALDLEPHQLFSFDVWKYWLSRKFSHPELHEIATLLLAVPSNQVSVERAFSALTLVLSDKRTRINEENLENILLIKLNRELFDNIVPNLYNWLDEKL